MGVFRLGAERRLTQGVRLANRRGRRPCRPGPDEALSTVLGEGQHHGNDCLQRRGTRQPLDRRTSAQREQALLRDQAAAARETSFWRPAGQKPLQRAGPASVIPRVRGRRVRSQPWRSDHPIAGGSGDRGVAQALVSLAASRRRKQSRGWVAGHSAQPGTVAAGLTSEFTREHACELQSADLLVPMQT